MKNLSICCIFLCTLFTAGSLHAQGGGALRPIEIKAPGGSHDWRFLNGPEFPGAQGALVAERVEGVQGGKISFSFIHGGAYVMAIRSTDIPEGYRELRFRVIGGDNANLSLRLIDSSGQTHQFTCGTYAGTEQWQIFRVDLTGGRSKASMVFGGAGDNVFHWPVREIAIIVNRNNEHPSGSVTFADITVIP